MEHWKNWGPGRAGTFSEGACAACLESSKILKCVFYKPRSSDWTKRFIFMAHNFSFRLNLNEVCTTNFVEYELKFLKVPGMPGPPIDFRKLDVRRINPSKT